MLSVVGFFGREFDSPRLHHSSFNIPMHDGPAESALGSQMVIFVMD